MKKGKKSLLPFLLTFQRPHPSLAMRKVGGGKGPDFYCLRIYGRIRRKRGSGREEGKRFFCANVRSL